MKKFRMPRSKIVATTVCLIVILLISSILLSTFWSNSVNPILLSTIINIISSLIGVSVGIITAIFIVEKYLDINRKEELELQQLHKQLQVTSCSVEITGRLSVHFENIIFLSYFLLFGRKNFIKILNLKVSENEIPESAGEFMMWINNVHKPDKLSIEELERFDKSFHESPEVNGLTNRDIKFLFHITRMSLNHAKDFLFLLQPFIEGNFELARNLVSFARDLNEFLGAEKSYLELILVNNDGNVSDDNLKELLASLGTSTINIYRLTHSYILK